MFKVVVTDYTYEDLNIERGILGGIEGVVIEDYQYRKAEDVIKIASDCDVLVVQYADVNRAVIESLKKCSMIIRYAIGVDNIDLKAATEKGIMVVNVPDYGIDEVSTYAVALLLCAVRKIPQTIDMIREKKWNYAITKPMYRTAGKTVGLVGLGRIPSSVAKKLSGFDMNIIAYDPYVSKDHADSLGVQLVSLEHLMRESDYISIHCPLTAETKHLFDAKAFSVMKQTAYLVNTARGGIVDSNALYDALKNHTIAGAAVDVTEQEPLPADSPLRELDNLIITPHIAWYTEDSIDTLKEKLANEIVRVSRGERPLNVVNKDVLKK